MLLYRSLVCLFKAEKITKISGDADSFSHFHSNVSKKSGNLSADVSITVKRNRMKRNILLK